jgi:catechol 2,3-dioxygenase-like lactoylglutathione lyase family enzyme
MFKPVAAFSGFSVDDLSAAKAFYAKTLGLELEDDRMGLLFKLPGGGRVFIYDKPNHSPATYTVLNFAVADIDAAAKELKHRGIKFELFEGAPQDDQGIARGKQANMGPDIAWFKDPAGNILSILEN